LPGYTGNPVRNMTILPVMRVVRASAVGVMHEFVVLD
jgi:hypothetical protein